jgi:presequence protease
MRSALAKQHGCDPENALLIQTLFEKLLEKTKDPQYLANLIRTYFLHNTHRVRLLMLPDPHLAEEETREERKMLQEIQKSLTEAEALHIVKQTQELKAYQKSTEEQSLECLPKVTLDDVSPIAHDILLKHHTRGSLEVFHHDCFTNHILYADLLFDLPPIADEDLPYVSLLTALLTEIGSGKRSYEENLDYIQAHTGGIGAACSLHLQVVDPRLAKPSFCLRGKALHRKSDKLFALMKDTLLFPGLDDPERISDLIEQLREAQVQRLNRQAMRYAVQLASSGSSPAAHVGEAWMGLRYFKTIESLAKDLPSQLPWLIDKLVALKEQLFTFQHLHLVLSCSKEIYETLSDNDFFHIGDLPAQPSTLWQLDYPVSPPPSQGRTIASQVAFSAEVFETIPYLHPHAAGLSLAATLSENKILHKRIREEGGAYGCGATFSANTGQFYFHAFRDPRIANTRQIFHAAIQEIAAGHFSQRDLEEAKLGVIQQLDSPLAPGSRAITAYGWLRIGKTREMRQQFRDRLLAATPQEVAHIVSAHLLPKKEEGVFVTLAGNDLLEKENKLFAQQGSPLIILPL